MTSFVLFPRYTVTEITMTAAAISAITGGTGVSSDKGARSE